MRRLVWNVFVVFLTLVCLVLLWQFRIALVLFLLSLVVSSAVRPSITGLINRGLSRQAALMLAYALLVLGMVGLVLLTVRPLARNMQTAADEFVTGYERAMMEWPRGGTLFQRTIVEQLPPTDEVFSALSVSGSAAPAMGLIGAAQDLVTAVGQFGIVIVLSIYWSSDQRRFERLSLTLLPKEHHQTARRVWLVMTTGVGAYVRGEVTQSVLAGLVLGGVYSLMGIRYAAVLALWVAIARLIPWFGALLAILLPFLAVIGYAPPLGIAMSFLTIMVLLALRSLVEPRFFDRNRYNALLIVLFIIAMTELFGIVGGLLAPTMAVTVQLVYEQVFPRPLPLSRHEIRRRMDALLMRISTLEAQVHENDGEIPHETLREIERAQAITAKLLDQLGD